MSGRGHNIFRGVIPAMVTPLGAGGVGIDEGAIEELVGFLATKGINGLFVLGTTGEGLLLGPEERNTVVRRTVASAGAVLPVIAQCGATDTFEAVELAQGAERAGAAAVAAYAPPFYPLDEQALLEYFRSVAAAVDIPVVLYQIPARNGHDLTPDLVGEIFRTVPNVIGIKDTTKSEDRLREYVAIDGLNVWVGSEDLMLDALELGAVGATSAVSSVVPEVAVNLYAAFAQRSATAAEIQQALNEFRDVLRTGPYLAAYKAALRWRGVSVRPDLRPPLRPLDPELWAQIEERFACCIETNLATAADRSEV